MSTSAEIGRRPTARRRRCSQSGDGPLVTPRTRRPAKAGQPSASSMVIGRGIGKVPATGAMPRAFNVPMPAAARSRAMPRIPRHSCRFGVMAISNTGSFIPAQST